MAIQGMDLYQLLIALGLGLLLYCPKPSTAVDNRGSQSTDGTCNIYDYVSGFSLKAVEHNRFSLVSAFCQKLPKPYHAQSDQCVLIKRNVNSYHENWNQCPAGFFIQSITQSTMWCCKPSDKAYEHYGCAQQTIKPNSYEIHCPAEYFLVKTRDSLVGGSVLTSAVACCKIPDDPAPVSSIEEVKARVRDDTQVPLSLLAHFLGYGWCGGCDARFVGESMVATNQGWAADTSGSCTGVKPKNRLRIDYADWAVETWNQEFSKVEHTDQIPHLILTGEFINNDSHAKTYTVGQELTRMHRITHTTTSSFTLSHEVAFEVAYKSSFLGGLQFGIEYKFGYENSVVDATEKEEEQGSALNYGTEVTLGPCSAVTYKIFLASIKATQHYDATLRVSYSAELNSFLRYGGGAAGRYTNFHDSYRGAISEPHFKYKFGNAKLSLHDDLKEQIRDGRGPWEWLNMMDRYPGAKSMTDLLSDRSRHEFNISGKFEEIAGQTASIVFQWKKPPARCVKSAPSTLAKAKRRRAVQEENPVLQTTTSDAEEEGTTASRDTTTIGLGTTEPTGSTPEEKGTTISRDTTTTGLWTAESTGSPPKEVETTTSKDTTTMGVGTAEPTGSTPEEGTTTSKDTTTIVLGTTEPTGSTPEEKGTTTPRDTTTAGLWTTEPTGSTPKEEEETTTSRDTTTIGTAEPTGFTPDEVTTTSRDTIDVGTTEPTGSTPEEDGTTTSRDTTIIGLGTTEPTGSTPEEKITTTPRNTTTTGLWTAEPAGSRPEEEGTTTPRDATTTGLWTTEPTGSTPKEEGTTTSRDTTTIGPMTAESTGFTPDKGTTISRDTTTIGHWTTEPTGSTPKEEETTTSRVTTTTGLWTAEPTGTSPEEDGTTTSRDTTTISLWTTEPTGSTPKEEETTTSKDTTTMGLVTAEPTGSTPEEGTTISKDTITMGVGTAEPTGSTPDEGTTTSRDATTIGLGTTEPTGSTPEEKGTTTQRDTTTTGLWTAEPTGSTPKEEETTTSRDATTIGTMTAESTGSTPGEGTTTSRDATTMDLGATEPTGSTPLPEMEFRDYYLRIVDMETGTWKDMADEDYEAILELLSPENTESPKDETKLTYLSADGTKNPNFDFTAFFVSLKSDNKLEGGTKLPLRSSTGYVFQVYFAISVLLPFLLSAHRILFA